MIRVTARDAHSGSLLATLVVAFAARARIPAPARNPAPALVFGGAKLPSELKLDPSLVKAIKLGPPSTAADEQAPERFKAAPPYGDAEVEVARASLTRLS